ncbi:PIN domain-containing protein [Aureimonas sp. SK2]|uniref:PIN domain-containing protein n=1 Tax=Aureimonas sp. SK2 TaxID=3015992 RepID=UPI0024441036|nr:PIN domain-containing protein [Aureimonas sp. SK2]
MIESPIDPSVIAEVEDLPAQSIGLRSRHVLIDTNIYRQVGFNLRSRLFSAFYDVASTHQLRIHIDPVISKEIDRGIAEVVGEISAQHKKWVRTQNQWNSRIAKRETVEPLDEAGMIRTARSHFDGILRRIGMVDHGLGPQTVQEALEHYFARKPPFDMEGSREFPDYFILNAAARSAELCGGMYVVTKDKAMLRAVKEFDNLYPVQGLEAFMSIIATLRDPKVEELKDLFLRDEDTKYRLADAFNQAVADEVILYEGWNYEDLAIDRFDIESVVDIVDFVVISMTGNTVVLSGILVADGQVQGNQEVEYDEGPDRPPTSAREEVYFTGRSSARVVLTFDRSTFDVVELEITDAFLNVKEPPRF